MPNFQTYYHFKLDFQKMDQQWWPTPTQWYNSAIIINMNLPNNLNKLIFAQLTRIHIGNVIHFIANYLHIIY